MDSTSSRKRHHENPDNQDHDSLELLAKSSKPNTILRDIPTTHHYQVSLMHRSTVTHACTSLRHGYVVTASVDGVVKFWKRSSTAAASVSVGVMTASSSIIGGIQASSEAALPTKCLEFVKSYSSHVGPILSLVISQPNGDSAVSIGWDGVIKFYDVATFDASGMIRTKGGHNFKTGRTNDEKKRFRLGRHAVLIEREELYLLVSTRAPTREEILSEQNEREQLQQQQQHLGNQQQQSNLGGHSDDSEDDGPCPVGKNKPNHRMGVDCNMVPLGSILLFSGTTLSSEPIQIITHHATPVTALAYHSRKQWVISGDVSGVLEIWNIPTSSARDLSIPIYSGSSLDVLPFHSKSDTDLYALIKKKTYAIDIAISEFDTTDTNTGYGTFAVFSSDRKIRLFAFKTCNLICIYDERLKVYDKLLSSKSSAMGMDSIEYGNRAALEREMEDAHLFSGVSVMNNVSKQSISTVTPSSEGSYHQFIHLNFDLSGKYLLVPTIVGIKVINIQTHTVVATVGKGDASSLRFLHVTLCPGDAKVDQQLHLARMGGSSAAISHNQDGESPPNDSLIIALAYGKRRFYAFSHHDPFLNSQNETNELSILARDILNEPPDSSDILEASHLTRSDNDPNSINARLTTATTAILRTTHGDITIKLFPNETPKTIQNFIGHAQSGYYDNVIFHRIIPGFMIQTGDPLGDGTGGESIWGGEFEDEIRRNLRHDRPFTVSMANAGPNTNGSQFFITTVPTPWLDNKHTVFGRVSGGMEVVMAIEGVKTDELDRPLTEVKILSVDVS